MPHLTMDDLYEAHAEGERQDAERIATEQIDAQRQYDLQKEILLSQMCARRGPVLSVLADEYAALLKAHRQNLNREPA